MEKKVKAGSKEFICFAGCDWWYHNHGLFVIQIMKQLSQTHRVLFINSLGMRVPSLSRDPDALKKIVRKMKSLSKIRRRINSNLSVMSPFSVPVLSSPIGRRANSALVYGQIRLAMHLLKVQDPVYYIGCPTALDVVSKMPPGPIIYERTDIFEEMPSVDKDYIAGLDRELMRKAMLVLYVNRELLDQGKQYNSNSLLIGHGVEYDRFVSVDRKTEVPEDIARIPYPVIGYFGDISNKTSDMCLLEHVAKTCPDYSIVLVGPISTDVSMLQKYKNVYFLGPKPYEQIPHYGKVFDVAIMPWNQNRWIRYCNPVKAKEYLALGNPIVTMYYPEVEPYRDLMYIANTHQEFVKQIQSALAEKDANMQEKRRLSVVNETWDSKAKTIIQSIVNV